MSTARTALRVFQMPAADGWRHCVFHAPGRQGVRGAVVYVHPFAEEMNKSRRMVALQARAFASEGYAVLLIDLMGCGDSSGDFADATWTHWCDDVRAAVRWVQRETGHEPWLWGLRAGALLCVQASDVLAGVPRFLFWQPAPLGRLVWNQFRRLQVAGAALRGEDAEPAAVTPGDETIAGYRVDAALSGGLSAATLAPPARASRSCWIEVAPDDGAALLPATQRALQAWQAAGHRVQAVTLAGKAFWQTTEIETVPALAALSVAQLHLAEQEAA